MLKVITFFPGCDVTGLIYAGLIYDEIDNLKPDDFYKMFPYQADINKYVLFKPLIYIVIFVIMNFIINGSKKLVSAAMFDRYKQGFLDFKRSRNITQEAIDYEQNVLTSNSDGYILRACEVSKLFFNSKFDPVYAVNQVSLGIKAGCCFGFLGANGAGKTTLMNIFSRQEVQSNGTIEIEGKIISNKTNLNSLSICPQFNDHLYGQMTCEQNLKFFARIFFK